MLKKVQLATCAFTALILSACLATPTTHDAVTIGITRCFGACPVYAVTVHVDGRVDFEGKRDVAHLGSVQRNIAPETAQKILRNLHAYRPATGTAQNNFECSHRATDHPSYNLTWVNNAQTTKYHHYLGCHSPENRAIAKQIKSAIDALNIGDLIKVAKPMMIRRKE